jgi:hypothetical protein
MKSLTFLLLVVVALLLTDNSKTATDTTDKGVRVSWSKADSKAYARDKLSEWQEEQWSCLNRLWGKESAWNMYADNPESSAYGIAQILNTEPGTPAPLQIEKGLSYIVHRYDKPSIAWAHHRKHGWY